MATKDDCPSIRWKYVPCRFIPDRMMNTNALVTKHTKNIDNIHPISFRWSHSAYIFKFTTTSIISPMSAFVSQSHRTFAK